MTVFIYLKEREEKLIYLIVFYQSKWTAKVLPIKCEAYEAEKFIY